MKLYHSTRDASISASADAAILRGIAPDGGLYVPAQFNKISLEALMGMTAHELFAHILENLLDGYAPGEMYDIVKKGYLGRFDTEDITPTVKAGGLYFLELFRGPTAAFKDVALSLLPYFITRAARKEGVTDEIRILTATSGDTGKAALAGFADVPGTSITVFYPYGGVSEIQRRQMCTQQGGNVRVCAVRGNFDDAQTGVKKVFGDSALNARLNGKNVRLSSANSINLGRLAPQVAYYFKSYIDLVRRGDIKLGDEINFAVPTGNFGDILAGQYARMMGLPVGKLVCASNKNNVLTDFLTTGTYDRRREFYKTASPSMDILVSSNLERCLHLMSGGDCALVKDLMHRLNTEGVYTAPENVMDAFRANFAAGCADDEAAFKAIRDTWENDRYLIDTHTAVGASAAKAYIESTGDTRPMVVLSTASPYKFAADVLNALGETGYEGFAALDRLNAITNVPIPKNLDSLRALEEIHKDVVDVDNIPDYAEA